MGILVDMFQRRSGVANPEKWLQNFFGGRESHSGIAVNESSALSSTAVFACIRLLSDTLASLPLPTYKRLNPRGKEKATKYPIYKLLHDKANPIMPSFIWRETMMGHILGWGNCYSEIEYGGNGYPIALWPLRPDRTRPERDKVTKELYYVTQIDGMEYKLPKFRVLHIPGLGFDGIKGYSPITLAREAIGLSLATEEFGARYFGSGTHPGAVVTRPLDAPIIEDQKSIESLRNYLTDAYGGLGKSHRLMLLEEGMDIKNIGIPPEDSQFLQCVVPETLINMADGTRKAAKDICKDDLIIGWDNGPTVSKITVVGTPPLKQLIKITTARGRNLTATYDHPCLIIRKFRTPGGRKASRIPEWVQMQDLTVGNYIRAGLGNTSIENKMSFNHTWFLGAMTGNGYIRLAGCAFSVSDEGVINKMQEVLSGFGGSIKKKPGDNYDWDLITNGNGCKGSLIRSMLNKSGLIGKHSNDKRVPPDVLSGGKEAWAGFLSGYFDTDGSIRDLHGKQKPAAYWSSINRDLLEDCQHLLSLLGIQSSIYGMGVEGKKIICGHECMAQKGWGLYVMGASQLKLLSETLVLSHTEKAKRLLGYMNTEPSRYTEDNFLYDRIVSIEDMGIGETIGIEVEGCHTYITNGLVTHNTRQFQVTEIARFFGVQPHLIGDLDKATFSNIESQGIEYVIYTLRPWLVRWEQFLNQFLIPEEHQEVYFCEFLVDGLLRGDFKSRSEGLQIQRRNGIISADDWCEIENKNPIGGKTGDLHIVESNMQSLEYLAENPGIQANKPPGGQTNPQNKQNSLKLAWKRLFFDALNRVYKREIADVSREIQAKEPVKRLEIYYSEPQKYMELNLKPVICGYFEAKNGALSTENMQKCEEICENFAKEHIKQSFSELKCNENLFTHGIIAEIFKVWELERINTEVEGLLKEVEEYGN